MRVRRILVGLLGMVLGADVMAVDLRSRLTGLDQPWGVASLSASEVLITTKSGRVWLGNLVDGGVRAVGRVSMAVVEGQGGLLDVVLHPRFAENRWVYFTYARRVERLTTTALARARLEPTGLEGLEELFVARAEADSGHHFGSRLAFDADGALYLTIGDRGDRDRAQDLGSHAGKVLRLDDRGRPAAGNPFLSQSGALPEIYSYGHRNPQGLVHDPAHDALWLHEHGPRGGDEINRVVAGRNYGWPLVSHGREYWGGSISEEVSRPGLEDPQWVWVPSIAPSGLAVYRGHLFRERSSEGSSAFLVGALRGQLLAVLPRGNAGQPLSENRWFESLGERIRDVEVTPDGRVLLLTDGGDARLLEVVP